MSYVESAGCLMSSLLGVLCRVCWVSYVESAGCLMSSLLGVLLLISSLFGLKSHKHVHIKQIES